MSTDVARLMLLDSFDRFRDDLTSALTDLDVEQGGVVFRVHSDAARFHTYVGAITRDKEGFLAWVCAVVRLS